jgi:perosamine synthetase
VYLHPWYRDHYGYGEGLCPNAEAYYAGAVSLPCFPTLTEDDQRRVVGAIEEVLAT